MTVHGTQEIVDEFRRLDLEAKLELLHSLWDEIIPDLAGRPPSEAERMFLEVRLRDIEADPRPDRSWLEVRDELLRGR